MTQSIGAILILWGLWVFLFNNKHKGVPLLLAAGLLFICIGSAFAHDMDHPEEDAWYEQLKQPDNENVSCCGKADAYWCDKVYTRKEKNYCALTDDRIIPNRTPHPVGMEIEIPDRKMMDGHKSRGNPTGHSVVFLTSGTVPSVYCFILSGGI